MKVLLAVLSFLSYARPILAWWTHEDPVWIDDAAFFTDDTTWIDDAAFFTDDTMWTNDNVYTGEEVNACGLTGPLPESMEMDLWGQIHATSYLTSNCDDTMRAELIAIAEQATACMNSQLQLDFAVTVPSDGTRHLSCSCTCFWCIMIGQSCCGRRLGGPSEDAEREAFIAKMDEYRRLTTRTYCPAAVEKFTTCFDSLVQTSTVLDDNCKLEVFYATMSIEAYIY